MLPKIARQVAELDNALNRGDLVQAKVLADALTKQLPNQPEHWRTAALIAVHLGEPSVAVGGLRRAIALAPESGTLRAELAAVLELLGEIAEAQTQLHEAIRLDPGEIKHRLKLSAVLLSAGKPAEAAMLARQVVARAPNLQAGWYVLADSAYAQGDWPAALRSFQRALELATSEGASASAKLWYNVGLCLGKLHAPERALIAFDRALALDAKLYAALAQRLFTQRKLADWRGLAANSERLLELVRLGVPGITPFSFLAEPASAIDQLSCARTMSKQVARGVGVVFESAAKHRGPKPAGLSRGKLHGPERKLRIGFVSNGFGQHPTGLLTVEFFELLDRARMQTVLFATAASDAGPIRQRLANAVELICDLTHVPAKISAKKIRELEIDVLFDLRGFGDGGVPELFALRPAPLQVNWLAYPGTTGAPWMDYVFADAQVISAEVRAGFSEAVVYLESPFQPYDAQSQVAELKPRSVYGLPDDAVVLSSLNNSYKINPAVFAAWCRILQAVPNAVLWLLSAPDAELFAKNMQAHAQTAGIDPARLIFLPKMPHAEYLAALAHSDLFLDTFPYGAHTTARDALFVGCPVLTIAGDTFAARVACSLNVAAGMQAFNTSDIAHYIASATQLANAPEQLKLWRDKLIAARPKLFDSARFAGNFMRAVELIDANARHGLVPQDLLLD